MAGASKRIAFACFVVAACIFAAGSVTAASPEYVLVQKVMDDQAVIVRSNGATFLIEKGIGCLSLWRYEGKRVVIDSPGLFLGVGSKLVIPDAEQECRIWNSKQIDSPRAQSTPATPAIRGGAPSPTEDEFSFFDGSGRASAYLEASDGLTFYLWSGEPVAYLVEDSVFGFNGKHLGWYHKGLVYDHDGGVVVAPAAAFRDSVAPAPIRSLKHLKPLKGLKELKPLRPLFGTSWSTTPARVFFLLGVD
jgi:4-fold beta flower protein